MEAEKQPSPSLDVPKGEAVVVAPMSWWNKWRDVGLYLALSLIIVIIILGWRESESRRAAIEVESKLRTDAIKKFERDTKAFRTELAAIKASNEESVKYKDKLAEEFKTTRKMVFEAWKHNKDDIGGLIKQIDALQKTVIRLEKTVNKKQEK